MGLHDFVSSQDARLRAEHKKSLSEVYSAATTDVICAYPVRAAG